MSNSWLCFRRRLLQTLQCRNISNLSWFQNRNSVTSLDAELLTVEGNGLDENIEVPSASAFDSQPLLLHGFCYPESTDNVATKQDAFCKIGKFDILSMMYSIGARNQELIHSLGKIIETLECKDTIHVGHNNTYSNGAHNKLRAFSSKSCTDIGAFKSFDLFTALDTQFLKDNRMHKTTSTVTQRLSDMDLYADSKQPTSNKKEGKDEHEGPSIAQLEQVKQYYIEIVPDFHRKGEDLSAKLHAPNIIFENHFFKKPKVTRGLQQYIIELSKLKILATLAYPSYYFEIQSITTHPKEGHVKMHWRMYYVSNWNFIRRIFTLMRDMKQKKRGHDSIDATSYFHVNKDGKVFRHRIDRVIPLKEEASPVEKIKAKTVEIVGLAPKAPCDGSSKGTI